MENEELSVIIRCWPDPQTNATRLRLVGVATGEEVHLNEGTFLLRISIDAKASVTRCFIRHIASGREAYVQSSSGLWSFIKASLVGDSEVYKPDDPNMAIE
jgi:hypothetical protein